MKRAKKPCKKTGCPALTSEGYCEKHAHIKEEMQAEREAKAKESLNRLKRKQAPEERSFYSSAMWTKVSRLYREKNPLCARCKKVGRVVPVKLVHHSPELREIIAMGESPYNEKYLEGLCMRCHNKEHLGRGKP